MLGARAATGTGGVGHLGGVPAPVSVANQTTLAAGVGPQSDAVSRGPSPGAGSFMGLSVPVAHRSEGDKP
jgi:hypothetical protein